MRKFLLVFLLVFHLSSAICQPIVFEKSYSHASYQLDGNKVIQLSDSSYVIAGYENLSSTYSGGVILKTDSLGNLLWSKSYSDTAYKIYFHDIAHTSNNTFIVTGEGSTQNKTKFLALELDSAGNILWSKSFGNIPSSQGWGTLELSDGDYLFVGRTYDFGAGGSEMYLLKINPGGNIVWAKTFGTASSGLGIDAVNSYNGNFCVMGGDSGATTLTEFDLTGNPVWTKQYNMMGIASGVTQWSVKRCHDDGYLIPGVCFPDTAIAFWPYLIRTDKFGNPLWSKLYAGPLYAAEFFDVIETSDNKIVASWEPEAVCQNCQGGMIKTDSSGNIIYAKCYELNTHVFPWGLLETSDHGYLQTGWADYFSGISLIKTDSSGITGCYDTIVNVRAADIPIWISGSGSSDSGSILNLFLPVVTYSPFVMNDECFNMDPVALFTSPDHTICPGTCTDFTNISLNATYYKWYFPGANPDSSISNFPVNICYSNPGNYDVSLIAMNNSGTDTLVMNNYITVSPYPAPQSISQSGDTLFAITGSYSYRWYFNGSLISGATDFFYVANSSGDYNVIAADSNSCEVEAAIFNVIASSPINEILETSIVYPNPVVDELKINSRWFSGRTSEIKSISIYNELGIEIQTFVDYKNLSVDCKILSPGFYFLKINFSGKIFRSNFIKQ